MSSLESSKVWLAVLWTPHVTASSTSSSRTLYLEGNLVIFIQYGVGFIILIYTMYCNYFIFDMKCFGYLFN